MRTPPALHAALVAALGLVAGAEPAWAKSPVVIEGATDEMREGIIDLLPDRDRPTTEFEAERIAEEAAARASVWLRSEGYYDATVTPDTSDNPVSAKLVIAPGLRYRFTAPTLVFDDATPDSEALAAATRALHLVEPDAAARAASVLSAEVSAFTALQQHGYADAAIGTRRVVVDHATQRVSAEFHFSAGAAVRLGAVRVNPETIFRRNFVQSLRNWRQGDPYKPEDLTRLRRDFTATGAISRVSTTLAPPAADGTRDVILDVQPAKRFAYELGFGYSTTEGLGVDASWTRRNLTGRADALTLQTTLGENLSSASVTWSRPHAAGLGHTLNLGASVAQEDTDAFHRDGVALFASVDAGTRLRVGRSYGVRLTYDQFDDTAGGVSNATVLSAFADLKHDTTDFTLDPRAGSILEGRIEPALSTGQATIAFMRATGEARSYQSFGASQRLTLAERIRIGWLEPIAGNADDVPADRRFYSGGGGSVRGYAYNSIYPHERDTLGLVPGGEGQLEGSVEARWRFDDRLGAAFFVDGGNAFDDWSNATDLKFGVGVGLRYNLGFAPLRVDVAVPLDRNEAHDNFALYISVGQAF
ncbi:MAG: autotransporter assembly complex family protein [Terricaulis sp.]